VGLFFVGVFAAVVLAYVCTEFLLVRLDARRRVLMGKGHVFLLILAANLASFLLLCLSSLVVVAASGASYYLEAAVVCLGAQAVWLSQHLWSYYRDHPRVRFER
jgi:hypothetical protein